MWKNNDEDDKFLEESSMLSEILSNDMIMCIWDCITLLGPPISFVLFLNSNYDTKYMWMLILSMCVNPISIKVIWKWFQALSVIAELIPFALFYLLAYILVIPMAAVCGGTWAELYVLRDLGKRVTNLLKGSKGTVNKHE